MPWLQLTLTADQDRAALLEAALENGGALAVTLGDAADDPLLEPPPGTTPLWQAVRLVALFEGDAAGAALATDLAGRLAHLSLTPPRTEQLADRVWERVWLDEFRPTRFGRRLWVCPVGQAAAQPAGEPDAVVVELDPGLAFGTGHHPTTALCLEWLDGAQLSGRTLLDYGCGSGILAIAALKLGAATVIAVDHDPQALSATRDNAAANAVADRLTVCLPDEFAAVGARLPVDCVVANILAAPLVALAPRLIAVLAPGGDLALSGVLAEQVPTVSAAYAGAIEPAPLRLREGWALLSGRRRIGG
jgi:ribosomal protein L11 methyltransferase